MPEPEDDYMSTFQRLVRVELALKREGPKPALLAAKCELELALHNWEKALNAAKELAAVGDNEAAKEEAERVIALALKKLRPSKKE